MTQRQSKKNCVTSRTGCWSTAFTCVLIDSSILACLTQVVDFNIHVTESGEEYNETIEVDTQKQTEVFKVPAHPGVDRSDVMHDFKQVIIVGRYMLRPFACCACGWELLQKV